MQSGQRGLDVHAAFAPHQSREDRRNAARFKPRATIGAAADGGR